MCVRAGSGLGWRTGFFVAIHLRRNEGRIVGVHHLPRLPCCSGLGDSCLSGYENPCIRWDSIVGSEFRRCGEDVAKASTQSIHQRVWAELKRAVDVLEHAAHAGLHMGDKAGANPGTDDKQHTAMRVDMIDSALRIILNHKNGGAFPYPTVRNELHHPAQGKIIVRNIGGAIGIAVGGAWISRVVIGQAVFRLWPSPGLWFYPMVVFLLLLAALFLLVHSLSRWRSVQMATR